MRLNLQNPHRLAPKSSRLSQFKGHLRVLSDWLWFRQQTNSNLKQFTNEWQNHHHQEFTLEIAKFSRWLFPLGFLAILSLKSVAFVNVDLLSWILLSILSWALTISDRLLVTYLKAVVSLASIVILVGATTMTRRYFSGPFEPESAVVVTLLFIGSLLFNIRIFPFRSPLVSLWAALHVLAGVYAFSANPGVKVPDLIAVLSVISAISVGFYYAEKHKLNREAEMEYTAREVLVEKEQAKIKAMRHDIAHASSIADQLDMPRDYLIAGEYVVSTYQRRYSALGGDWASYHTFSDGRTALLVADATGKGVQAALVIHALKAMWATAVESDALDPLNWLDGVNKVFYQLGHKQDHTLTLGLLLLDRDKMTYYSAGHLPVFLIKKDGVAGEPIELISGRGRPIGIAAEIDVEPVTSRTALSDIATAMLGTDGVFERGHRTRKREILRLKLDLETEGEAALNHIPKHDDQLVVWLRPTG